MSHQQVGMRYHIRAWVMDLAFPAIRDVLVLGKQSPIGCAAMRRALDLLSETPFEHFELMDDVIGDVLVRAAIVRRIPKEELVAFLRESVSPLMGLEDIVNLDIDAEVIVGGGGA